MWIGLFEVGKGRDLPKTAPLSSASSKSTVYSSRAQSCVP